MLPLTYTEYADEQSGRRSLNLLRSKGLSDVKTTGSQCDAHLS